MLLLAAVVGAPVVLGGVELDALPHGRGGRRPCGRVGAGPPWLRRARARPSFVVAAAGVPPRRVRVRADRSVASSVGCGAESQGGVDSDERVRPRRAGSAASWLRRIEDDARCTGSRGRGGDRRRRLARSTSARGAGATQAVHPVASPEATLELAFWFAALLLGVPARVEPYARTAAAPASTAQRCSSRSACSRVVGILSHLTAPDRLLWLRAAPEGTRPFGPYVNPESLRRSDGACRAVAARLRPRGAAAHATHGGSQAGRRRCRARGRARSARPPPLLAASKMGAAGDRAVASTILIAIDDPVTARGRWYLPRRQFVVALAARGYCRVRTPGRKARRFRIQPAGGISTGARGQVWTAALRMAGDYVLTGSGFGAFSDLIPAYLPRGDSGSWLQLHNDYLEVFLAGGVVAAALIGWLAVAYVSRVARAVRLEFVGAARATVVGAQPWGSSRSPRTRPSISILQVPANALLFVVIAAIGAVPARRVRRGRMSELHIVHVAGARPNFMKIAPILAACTARPGLRSTLVHTGPALRRCDVAALLR